jgi:hypothetical protein
MTYCQQLIKILKITYQQYIAHTVQYYCYLLYTAAIASAVLLLSITLTLNVLVEIFKSDLSI